MKILQLNVWTGRMKGALSRFLRENDYDVVCLQEAVWSKEAPDHLAHFADTVDVLKEAGGFDYEVRQSNWGVRMLDGTAVIEQGNAILSKIPIVSSETPWIHGTYSNERNYVKEWHAQVEKQGYGAIIAKLENGFTIVTHHGYWQANPLGNEVSVECAQRLADLIRDVDNKLVFCGDLNLEAAAPAMREFDFLKDLTVETGTKQTLMNLKFVKDVACDHILISNDLEWSNFEVHKELVSDHAAVSVEIKE